MQLRGWMMRVLDVVQVWESTQSSYFVDCRAGFASILPFHNRIMPHNRDE